MKKIISLTALILCMAMLLASCSFSGMSFKKFYKDAEYQAPKQFSTSKQIATIDGLTFEEASGDLLLFTTNDGKGYRIYNAKTDAIILTFSTENAYTEFFTVFDTTFVKVTETKITDTTTTYVRIYNTKGELVADSKDPTDESITTMLDFFKFNGTIYRVNENGSASVYSSYYLPNFPAIAEKTENYYYTSGTNEVSVYDNDLNFVFYWEFPSENITNRGIFLLEDGVLLAQGTERLPNDAKKYDYASSGTKYNIVSYILNVEKDKVKEVNLDYKVTSTFNMDSIDSYNEDEESSSIPVDNYALVKFINDHRLDSRDTPVTIKNSGDTVEIAPEFDSLPTMVTENRWIYTKHNGEQYLIDENGDVIGNITGTTAADRNDKFIRIGQKLYDYDLELVYDAKEHGQRIVSLLQTSVILVDESPDFSGNINYYLYKADKTSFKIENYDNHEKLYYITYDEETQAASIYAENGNLILAINCDDINSIYEENTTGSEMMILCITDSEGRMHYYKIA